MTPNTLTRPPMTPEATAKLRAIAADRGALRPRAKANFPTLRGLNIPNTEKSKLIRQYLPTWLDYAGENNISRPDLAELVGVAYVTLSRHILNYQESPEDYGVLDTLNDDPSPDGDQPAPPTAAPEWGNTFPEWEQYRRKNMLSTQAMADNVGIDRDAYLNQLSDYRAKTAKANQPAPSSAVSGDVVERKPRPSDSLFEFNCPVTARIAVWNRWHPPHSRVAIITAGGIEHGHTITPATMTTAHTAVCTVMFDKMLLVKQEVDLTHLIPLGIYTNNSPITGRQYAACPHCRNWNIETVGHATTCPDCGKPL